MPCSCVTLDPSNFSDQNKCSVQSWEHHFSAGAQITAELIVVYFLPKMTAFKIHVNWHVFTLTTSYVNYCEQTTCHLNLRKILFLMIYNLSMCVKYSSHRNVKKFSFLMSILSLWPAWYLAIRGTTLNVRVWPILYNVQIY